MVEIHITPDQLGFLLEILERELRGLRSEIHHTDSRDYRERLLARRKTLEDLLAVLREHESPAAV